MSREPEEEGVTHEVEEGKVVAAKLIALRPSYGFQKRLWERGDKGYLYEGETLPVSKIAPLFLVDGVPQEVPERGDKRPIPQDLVDRLAPREKPPVVSKGKPGRKPKA